MESADLWKSSSPAALVSLAILAIQLVSQCFGLSRKSMNGNVALPGVNYPANSYGNVVRGATGAPSMIGPTTQAKEQCPGTKLAFVEVESGCERGAICVERGRIAI